MRNLSLVVIFSFISVFAFPIDFNLGLSGNINFNSKMRQCAYIQEQYDEVKALASDANQYFFDHMEAGAGGAVSFLCNFFYFGDFSLGSQIEVSFYYNVLHGFGRTDGSAYFQNVFYKVNSIDIPLFLKASYKISKYFDCALYAGGYVCVPLGDLGPDYIYTYNNVGNRLGKSSSGDKHTELAVTAAGAAFGISGGASLGLLFNPFRFFVDFRYIYDLTPIQGKSSDGVVHNILYRNLFYIGGGVTLRLGEL